MFQSLNLIKVNLNLRVSTKRGKYSVPSPSTANYQHLLNKLFILVHSVVGPTRPAFLSSTRFRKSLISLFVKTCLIPHSSRCSTPVALLPKRESLCTKLNHLSHQRSQKTNFMTPTIVRDQFLENRANIVLPFISAILGFSKCNTYTIAGNIAYKDYDVGIFMYSCVEIII